MSLPAARRRNFIHQNPHRLYRIMSPDELAYRKKEEYTELEIAGIFYFNGKNSFLVFVPH